MGERRDRQSTPRATSGRERRRAFRARARLRVEFGPDAIDRLGFTKDISVGGLFLVTRELVARGTRIHLRIELPKSLFYAEGRVLRVHEGKGIATLDPPGMGVRFVPPAEIVGRLVPRPVRKDRYHVVECSSRVDVERLIGQLSAGALPVPIGNEPAEVGLLVQYELRLLFGDEHRPIRGTGTVAKITRVAGTGARVAVLDVEGAAVRSQLEQAVWWRVGDQ
ncbi:MAG: PilZ domain-containing protein [Deltaproteobacteria bacterium]|nr:PilZ domain-containing protein [Deltaproteobacteria bacterium]